MDAAERIEPLVQVVGELIALLKRNHLKRMSTGECNVYADATFSDLMVEFHRIGDVCSNVGVATMVRVHPELADHEHLYYERLHSGSDEAFNAAYDRARQRYFSLLQKPVPKPEVKAEGPQAAPKAEEPAPEPALELGPEERMSAIDPEQDAQEPAEPKDQA